MAAARFMIEADGLIYREIVDKEPMCSVNDFVAKSTAINGVIIEDWMDGYSIKISLNPTKYMVFKTLDSISIKTHFHVHEDGLSMKPSFRKTESSVVMDLKWTPPEGYVLVFIWGGTNTSYLLLVGENRVIRPPFPNLYEDGRICLGNDFQTRGISVFDQCKNAIEYINSSVWNADLIDRMEASCLLALMTYSNEGVQNVPAENWEGFFQSVSSANYDSICENVQSKLRSRNEDI